jgi:hypothetical protein
MSDVADEFRLEDIVTRHNIASGLFVPFTALRLRGDSDITEAAWTISLRDVGMPGEKRRSLRVYWSADSVPVRRPGVADHIVTEWAALGMACLLVAQYTTFHIFETARAGDCVDFWITDGHELRGLEVSGARSADLESRHRAKVAQWRPNPYRAHGVVVVAGFDARQAIVSFQRFSEGTQ